MSVLNRLLQPVDEELRQLGESIVAAGAVTLSARDDGAVLGDVLQGTGSCQATLERDNGKFRGSCSCGECTADRPCAHVVATLLAADESDMIDAPPAGSTQPRGSGRPMRWLSPTGQLRRIDVDEPRPRVQHRPSAPTWRKQLAKIHEAAIAAESYTSSVWPTDRQVLYLVDLDSSTEQLGLVIRLAVRDRKSTGQWSRPKARGVSFPDSALLPQPEDRQIIAMLKGGSTGRDGFISYDPVYNIAPPLRRMIIEAICATGRAMVCGASEDDDFRPLSWDPRPWELWLEGRLDEALHQHVFTGVLRRGEERMPISRPQAILPGGVGFLDNTAIAIDDGGAPSWIAPLRHDRKLAVPAAQASELLAELFSVPNLPRLDLPGDLAVQTIRTAPQPVLRIRPAKQDEFRQQRLRGELLFNYGGTEVPRTDRPTPVYRPQEKQLILRDSATERTAMARLVQLGLREAPTLAHGVPELWFNHRHLPRIVRQLVQDGWLVEAEGKLYRRAGGFRMSVSSGIDWFELRGQANFDGLTVELPELLAAARRGQTMVPLGDGSVGLLPEEWLRRFGLAGSVGVTEGDFVRFEKAQVGMLDLLLSEQAEVTCDETFQRAREELGGFGGVQALEAPAGFVGELRHYQKEGMGWFEFLRRFGFGGCLADDMGLGKTIQVLALLEARREERAARGVTQQPSLVVVPRSLVFNWHQEASRFTPTLRILDHTGIDRLRDGNHLGDYDLVITTYGTLRRDATFLKDVEFDYVVLDEAQAVKNSASESAKAARLIKGRHRLALSGTPVQNHLGELWSLFDFLNPGMLGSTSVFTSGANTRNPEPETRTLLARAFRPFIMRRTKEQVAPELPPKLEQTLFCELESEQRKLYDELRQHYRATLLEHVDRQGLGKSKMQILEALLRLRQAALHPGLIDKTRTGETSAKLELLLMQLDEVLDEGHKALVFSQFTSMLAIVRQRLDARQVVYEYLDGKTRDRQARVERFQNDTSCRLFLISLKAGGLGLNLTAADYVFLLDPWWNPAVESQAIDRTHRIGQDKSVYACRIIAKDTVEEKVLSLQETKRDLADAIITANNSLLRSIGRDELELLLS